MADPNPPAGGQDLAANAGSLNDFYKGYWADRQVAGQQPSFSDRWATSTNPTVPAMPAMGSTPATPGMPLTPAMPTVLPNQMGPSGTEHIDPTTYQQLVRLLEKVQQQTNPFGSGTPTEALITALGAMGARGGPVMPRAMPQAPGAGVGGLPQVSGTPQMMGVPTDRLQSLLAQRAANQQMWKMRTEPQVRTEYGKMGMEEIKPAANEPKTDQEKYEAAVRQQGMKKTADTPYETHKTYEDSLRKQQGERFAKSGQSKTVSEWTDIATKEGHLVNGKPSALAAARAYSLKSEKPVVVVREDGSKVVFDKGVKVLRESAYSRDPGEKE